jgi:hypothetical protein
MIASGKNDVSSILKISSRCQLISQQTSTTPARPVASVIQNQSGAGTLCGSAAGAGIAAGAEGRGAGAATLGVAAAADAAPSAAGSCSEVASAAPSAGGSARPDIGASSSATMPPPAWTSPVVSTALGGAVAPPYKTMSSATIVSAGSAETNSWLATARFERPGVRMAPQSPAMALRRPVLSDCESGGRSTWRSSSPRGGARCGLSLARTIT